MKTTITAAFFAVGLLGLVSNAQQTIHVPADHPTIQGAIVAANPGDTIQVAAGLYVENLDFLGKEIQLIGAGIGQTILDGGQNGSVIVMQNGEGNALVQDVTIQNGTGTPVPTLSGSVLMGGGVFLKSNFNNTTGLGLVEPTFRRCRVTANTAQGGAGVLLWNGVCTFEDCDFENNFGSSALGTIFTGQNYVVRRCRFVGNTSPSSAAIGYGGGTGGSFIIEDCYFGQNVATGSPNNTLGGRGGAIGLGGGNVVFRRCIFDSNVADRGGAIATFNLASNTKSFENCLFVNNFAAQEGGVLYTSIAFGGDLRFKNCTMVGNSAGLDGQFCASNGAGLFWNVDVTNSILRGPTSPGTLSVDPIGVVIPTFKHCDIQGGWTGPGYGNFDLPPLFEDATNGDYRIRPDSPCVDAGLTLTGTNVVVDDFEGDPRPLFGGVDVGYDECGDFILDPAAAGTVGLAATGNATDVLTVNGSSGGALRRVDLALNQPLQLDVALPPGHPGGADFVLYGLLGTPSHASVTGLPFGLPSMVVPPCDLYPTFQPLLFTLASSVTGLACQPAFAAPAGAPWTTGPLAGLPFPVTFGLQGLIVEDAQGTVAATNALRVRVQ